MIKDYNDVKDEFKKSADEYFFTNIFPIIIPIAVDATHPFPHLNNLSFSLAVKLQDADNPDEVRFGMVRIPRVLPRYYQVSDNILCTIRKYC